MGALVGAGCGSSSETTASTTTAGTVAPGPSTTTGVPSTSTLPAQLPTRNDASQTIGVTSNTITIGQIATLSGPIPGLFQNAKDSLDAFVAYQNSIGGVDGKTLKVDFKDDALNCNTYTDDINALVPQVFAIVGTFSVLDACGQKALTANPAFPDVQAYLFGPQLYSTPNAITASPQPPGYPNTAALWIKDKFPNDITHTGVLYSLTSKSSYNEISAAFKSEGFRYVYSRGLSQTETNFTSDILRMKADGVKIVDMSTGSAQVDADFVQQAAQQDFHPDAIISPTAYDASFFKLVGADNADNVYMPLLYPMYLGQDNGTNAELKTYLTWLTKTHPGDTANIYGVDAWASGVLFVQALQAAGSTPNRSALINQLNKITSFSADGLLPASNPAAKQGATCIVVVGISGTKYVRLDPPTSGFECNGTYVHISQAQASA